MKLIFSLLAVAHTFILAAQFSIPEPIINSGEYAITDTVYMDPNGNDSNPGTYSQPVKSFTAAIQKLPYGTAGVNGGNAYGLIMLKPGHYITATGFQQYINNWKNGNTYRNISVEGIGEVIIGGTSDNFATGHLLVLSGDHIFIKNLKLKYSTGIGISLGRADGTNPRQRNVLIENVIVDSVGSFSMLLRTVDTILVRHSKSLYSSRPGNDQLTSPCSWPSGIKFYNSSDCIIHDTEIAYTRGEGLNFQNSIRGEAYRNKLHDNSQNFYNDNSAKLLVHHNLIYNTPGISTEYWRSCPANTNPTWAGGGILIANEGSCDRGSNPTFDGCRTKCILPAETFSNVDSMFIYNNIFQNTGEAIGFWNGRTDIAGKNCIRNVFIYNNTIIGVMGMAGAPNSSVVNAFFPDYNLLFNNFYGYLQNVRINNNIFTYDTAAYPNMLPVKLTFHPNHPGPKDITFDGNLWVKSHNYMGANGQVRNDLLPSTYLLTDSLNTILPCPDNQQMVFSSAALTPAILNDYLFKSRNMITNAGALEYSNICQASTGISKKVMDQLEIYPNPCANCSSLILKNLPHGTSHYSLYSILGERVAEGLIENDRIHVSQDLNGMYVLVVKGKNHQQVKKVIIYNQ